MIVSSDSQTLEQPQACYFLPQQNSNSVMVNFYRNEKCDTESFIASYTASFSQPPKAGCVPFSDDLCKKAWEAFTTSQPKSARLIILQSGAVEGEETASSTQQIIAYFYSTDDCSGNPIKNLQLVSVPSSCSPQICKITTATSAADIESCLQNSQCYSATSGAECFDALKQQLESTPQQFQFCENIVTPTSFDLQAPSLLALLFTFSFLGMIYAIGELSNSSSIKAFVKTEYFEAIKGAILLVGIISIVSTLNSLILPLTGEKDLVNGACSKALYILRGNQNEPGIENILQEVFNYAFYLGILAPFSFNFGVGFGVGPFRINDFTTGSFMPSSIIEWAYPPTKFTLMNFIVNDVVYGIENSFIMSIARLVILNLTPVFVFQFLFPVGLFLRCFPILRKIGGFFIALGIGLLVIYPSLVLFIDYPFMRSIINAVYPTSSQLSLISSSRGSGFKSEYTIPVLNIKIDFISLIATFLTLIFSLIPGIGALVGALVGAPVTLFLVAVPSINSLYLPLNLFLSAAAANIGQMVIVFIDLLIMYTLLLDLSNIIGGKFTIAGREISGFGFLKL
jgi:hypothetical protein